MINANAIAIAGGAVAASLVDVLTDKGLLTEDEAASVRAKALQLLTPYTMTSSDADAAFRFITDMLVGFAERARQIERTRCACRDQSDAADGTLWPCWNTLSGSNAVLIRFSRARFWPQ